MLILGENKRIYQIVLKLVVKPSCFCIEYCLNSVENYKTFHEREIAKNVHVQFGAFAMTETHDYKIMSCRETASVKDMGTVQQLYIGNRQSYPFDVHAPCT